MDPIIIKTGMNLRAFEETARMLGCMIYTPRRTGEVCIAHSAMATKLRLNGRRKDTERRAAVWLRTLVVTLKNRSTSTGRFAG